MSPRKRWLTFYLVHGAIVATAFLSILVIVSRKGLFYPIIYFPGSQTRAQPTPQARSCLSCVVCCSNGPWSFCVSFDINWVWMLILPGLAALVLAKGSVRKLSICMGLMVLSMFLFHFEPRYYTIWIALWALVACAGFRLVLSRFSRDVVESKTARVLLFIAIVVLTALSRKNSTVEVMKLAEKIKYQRTHAANQCQVVKETVPPGEVILMGKAGHANTFACLFEENPAYGFTDDTEAIGAGWTMRDGSPRPLEPYEPKRYASSEFGSALLRSGSSPLPFLARAPSLALHTRPVAYPP